MKILLGHGSGGKLTFELIEKFFPPIKNEFLEKLEDSAGFSINGLKLSFTTDAFIVSPLIFKGGDIGKLSVTGTVNDLVVSGAKPLFISSAFILEEGFSLDTLKTLVESMGEEARKTGVKIIAADTKVVEKGKGDGLFIISSGIGLAYPMKLSKERILEGDKILITGTIGDHEAAIAASRLDIETQIQSDCAPLNLLLEPIFNDFGEEIKFMRDPTRGGLATVLNEISRGSRDFVLFEEKIPIKESVRGICEMLGFDPLYMACEGRAVLIVSKEVSEKIVSKLRESEQGSDASEIGEVLKKQGGRVLLNTQFGGMRILDVLTAEQLPRIC
jgi:hydrogenase expression/formation protein HypE